MSKTKKLALLGAGVALSMIFAYIEVLIPPISGAVPGIKIGLANIVTLFLLYKLGAKEAAAVTGVRVLLTALLFGSAVSLIYSVAGAVLSLTVMILLKLTDKFSPLSVSVSGAVAHNIGQIIAAMFLLGTAKIGYYLSILALVGVASGAFVGIAAWIAIKTIKKI
ncbi:MAG: Gx transporter family protein [Clostridia bacterium]|nr:Gx transporter family protein [Clostridia bacterium]